MLSAFIGDGYTESAYIAEAPRLHPAVSFEFRPILVAERSRMAKEADQQGVEFNAVAARWMVEKLVSWSLGDKPDTAKMQQLRPRLFDRMLAIMTGQDAGDIAPGGAIPKAFNEVAEAKNSAPA